MYHLIPSISGLIGRWMHYSLCEMQPMNYCGFTDCITYRIGRSQRPISYFKAINDLAYLFWLNAPRIASHGFSDIKKFSKVAQIRRSSFFYVFAYSGSHSLTFTAHYGIMSVSFANRLQRGALLGL